MKKSAIVFLAVMAMSLLVVTNGCKTSEAIVDLFSLTATAGYSKKVVTVDPDDTGLTSLNMYFAVRNHGDVAGTITRWSFKIRHNIVTLVEINDTNYQTYRLVISGSTAVPPDEIREFFVTTPPPFEKNALTKTELSFDFYTPTEVIAEVDVTDDNGEVHTITASGKYVYEKGTSNESKYNIKGNWEFKRTVNGQAKEKQMMVFMGTKMSGRYLLYKFGTNTVDETGSYTVTNYKYLAFIADMGTRYWGEFSDEANMSGTLLIPASKNQDSQTGAWTGKKL